MTIHVLDPVLIAQIAAGEVIERPASVVKELVENSVDAHARRISVELHGGGLSLIRVSDDGEGIPHDEVPLAFNRHATSKLNSLSDLEHIASLGFRGEALPSIAAVADIELVTAVAGEIAGTGLKLEYGAMGDLGREAHPRGTTIAVHRLFHTTPARLKFMKSARAEGARVSYLMDQFALAYPEIRFSLSLDGRAALQTHGSGMPRDAVAQVYGAEVSAQMLDVGAPDLAQGQTSGLSPAVLGLVSPPHLSRSTRAYLSFFVNRRLVFDRILSSAVEEAYRSLLMTGRHPIVLLNLSISPDLIDINVHPTKREVRFRHESLVFSAVNGAIKKALGAAPPPELPVHPLAWHPDTSGPAAPSRHAETVPWAVPPLPSASPHPVPQSLARQWPGLATLRVLGQLDSTYVVASAPDGLYLVDQHAAHERVLFDQLRQQLQERRVEVQGLLQPLLLELSAAEDELMAIGLTKLAELGFSIEPFGERSYLVRAVPAVLSNGDAAAAVRDILAQPAREDQPWLEAALASIACHGAIRAGRALGDREAHELLRQLEISSSPRTCPHGRPTMVHLSSGELRRHFGRE